MPDVQCMPRSELELLIIIHKDGDKGTSIESLCSCVPEISRCAVADSLKLLVDIDLLSISDDGLYRPTRSP